MRSKSKSSPIQKSTFDYKANIFECKLLKKKLFGTSSRFLYLFDTYLIINKEPQKKKPDRILVNSSVKRIIWKYNEDKKQKKQLRGFSIDYEDKSYEYQGDEITLKELKKSFAQYFFQARVQDEYEAVQVIGKGNYALVLELRHLHSNNILASKCIDKKQLDKVENGMNSVLNEIKIMRTLTPHQGIINLFEVYEGDNNIYLIMDFAEGGCLFDEIKNRPTSFTRKEIQIIMFHLLQAIAYMHSKNIMHRDLKPENILYKTKGDYKSLKIADFGLSTFADDVPYLYPKCGTPGYVAPEIANLVDKSQGYQPACDIFSAGVIFHQLLLNEGLFQGKGHTEILKANKQCVINPNDKKYDLIDWDAKDLLFKMVEKNPEKRYSAVKCYEHDYFKYDETPISMTIPVYNLQQTPPKHHQDLGSPEQSKLGMEIRTPIYHKKKMSQPDSAHIDFQNISVFSLDKLDHKSKQKSHEEEEFPEEYKNAISLKNQQSTPEQQLQFIKPIQVRKASFQHKNTMQ